MSVRIFLDVDGVLNAVGDDPHPPGHWGDFQEHSAMGFKIQFSPKMGEALRSLNADITWLTTWEGQANNWLSPLWGWGELPVLARSLPSHFQGEGWWKADVLADEIAATPGPFIWIDDDLPFARRRNEVDFLGTLPCLLVEPDFRFGITPAHIESMRDFIIACDG